MHPNAMVQNKLKNTTGLQVGEVIYMTSTYTVEDDWYWETFPTYKFFQVVRKS